ncbi:efflux RND transporter periplasmic adaptor subunit [Vibrio breoganii]|uniref:efflux RND transporter periplasmic adaptor subunit n=1 Tax=Vibrio breoganii TaxID=553239 RepID=UPI00080E68FD|nr:efflux RND transporter periplasmic adaptor subunit [Vibrio breoganii]OCH76658.1 efflux transporter periplasmic adaptor subunit [Vibrio breoganii]PML28263.1 efflux transporter periplasmic adaptor subunit [Vibrio breoganii]
MNKLTIALLSLVVGGVAGGVSVQYLSMHAHVKSEDMSTTGSDEPLYWVAPMDPNYQRDKPGKSPMGMDLVPVYAEDLAGGNDQPGTVKIDPAVENNLGVKVSTATLDTLQPKLDTVGYVRFDESRLWQTNVRVNGWVQKLNVNAVGEKVTKGQVLFTFYSPELVKAQEELLNAYRSKRKSIANGARQRLLSLGVDSAQLNYVLKRGKAIQNIAVKAPSDGVVATLDIREGSYITPAMVTLSAGPLDKVWVDAEVFERESHWLENGATVDMIADALPGESWQGEVDYIYPILDADSRTFKVRLVFDNPDFRLKPNMFASLSINAVSDEPSILIPRSAVIRSGGMTRVVLSLGEGKYRSARIEVGREDVNSIEVLQGLEEGDRVVTSAHFMLDSESSQTADLSRINGVEAPQETAWAKGEITDVMLDHGMLTINHEPVPEWDWPGMTMNFNLAKEVEVESMQVGQSIDFEMRKSSSGQYEIVDYQLGEITVAPEVWVKGNITMLMADFGMVTFSHQPSQELGWDAGEMNFTAGDEVDLDGFVEGQDVEFLIQKQGSDYLLLNLKAKENSQ